MSTKDVDKLQVINKTGTAHFRDTHVVPELLAPAGGPEQFYAALAAGADAIYCALGSDFNARRGATNFDYESFDAACKAAHLQGVRVYVTINIVIRSDEMQRALALIRKAWLLGADAFIIQDWGLLSEVRTCFPELECHISTQANVHDGRAVAWCRELGVSRVTLSRELSLKEIEQIATEGVELESFGHGALCFCYSGVCMMSSLVGSRSANRGLCAQPCRLLYDLVDERGHTLNKKREQRPLCPKDYCTIDDLERLRDAGLGSLKLEGRMKSPDYVYSVVSSYREELDDLAAGRLREAEHDTLIHRRLRRAFNRDFTNSYLDDRSDNDMMSYERSNNRGELVGTVLSAKDLGGIKVRRGGSNGGRDRLRSKSCAEVRIHLTAPVGKGDLLEIRPIDDPVQFLTTHAEQDAKAGETICCKTARPMAEGCPVRVIRSQAALDEAARVSKGSIVRRRAIRAQVVAHVGQPFTIELSCEDGLASVRVSGFIVEKARTKAVSAEDLKTHVGRLGQTPFEAIAIEVELDEDCGMSFSSVHALRTEACNLLESKILEPYATERRAQLLMPLPSRREISARPQSYEAQHPSKAESSMPEICALVSDVASAEEALLAGATRLYATADTLLEVERTQQQWPQDCVPRVWLDEICREKDHDRLDSFVQKDCVCAVGNVSELALAQERGAWPEIRPCIPVHNESAVRALEAAGAQAFWFSPELTIEELSHLAHSAQVPSGLLVWGRTRAMTSEHCVLQVAHACIHDCEHCKLRTQKLSLKDKDGSLLPVRSDAQGRSRIYAARPLDATPHMAELLDAGLERFLVDGTLLSAQELGAAVRRTVQALNRAKHGEKALERAAGASCGHLFERIG